MRPNKQLRVATKNVVTWLYELVHELEKSNYRLRTTEKQLKNLNKRYIELKAAAGRTRPRRGNQGHRLSVKSIPLKVYELLKEHNRPMYLREITRGLNLTSAENRMIAACLCWHVTKGQIFYRASRGCYGLQEWLDFNNRVEEGAEADG